MKLDVRHFYPCSVDQFWEMYWDDDYDAMLKESSTVQREVVDQRDDGESLFRKLRFTPDNELPGPIAKMIGAKKLIYEQDNVWKRALSQMTWEVLPTFLPGKFLAKGIFEVLPSGEGCEQRITGEITVNVRFIGGQIEKQIVSQVEQTYERMAASGRRWLDQKDQKA